MKYLLAILLLVGCAAEVDPGYQADYEDARRATVDAWENKIEPVSKKCYDLTRETLVVEVVDIPKCGDKVLADGEVFSGCAKYSHKQIWILELLDEYEKIDTAVHEWVHVLSQCEWDVSDKDHVIVELWEDNSGVDSVEAWGCAGLVY